MVYIGSRGEQQNSGRGNQMKLATQGTGVIIDLAYGGTVEVQGHWIQDDKYKVSKEGNKVLLEMDYGTSYMIAGPLDIVVAQLQAIKAELSLIAAKQEYYESKGSGEFTGD